MAFAQGTRTELSGLQAGSADIEVNAINSTHLADGAVVPESIGLAYRNESGGSLSVGDLVYVSGYSTTESLPLVTKADADVSGALAQWVVQEATGNNANSALNALKRYRLTAVDTSLAGAAGDPVYLHTTAGGWTLSAPSGSDDCVQIVGYVAVKDATVGEVEFNLTNQRLTKIATNELQALSVTAAKVAANTLTSAEIAPSVIQYAAVQITNSQLKALRAAPVQIVAAPGAAKIIQFLGAVLTMDYGSDVLTEAGDNLAIKYVNGSGVAVSQTVEMTGFIDQAGDMMTNAEPVINAIATKAQCENQVLCLHNIGGAEFGGNAGNDTLLYVHVAYKVINSNW